MKSLSCEGDDHDEHGRPGRCPGGAASIPRPPGRAGRPVADGSLIQAGYFGPDSPPVTDRGGTTTFEWLDGKFFLIQRFVVEHPAAPSGIAIIGLSAPEVFAQHYYDSRGVARVYQMTLADGAWKVWREAPGFWQRYTGTLSADGAVIRGAWEASADGSDWKHALRCAWPVPATTGTTRTSAGPAGRARRGSEPFKIPFCVDWRSFKAIQLRACCSPGCLATAPGGPGVLP